MAGAHNRDPGGTTATTWLAATGAENGRRCATAALGLPPAQDALFITCISLAGLRTPNAGNGEPAAPLVACGRPTPPAAPPSSQRFMSAVSTRRIGEVTSQVLEYLSGGEDVSRRLEV
jgi:hypothetical protein